MIRIAEADCLRGKRCDLSHRPRGWHRYPDSPECWTLDVGFHDGHSSETWELRVRWHYPEPRTSLWYRNDESHGWREVIDAGELSYRLSLMREHAVGCGHEGHPLHDPECGECQACDERHADELRSRILVESDRNIAAEVRAWLEARWNALALIVSPSITL